MPAHKKPLPAASTFVLRRAFFPAAATGFVLVELIAVLALLSLLAALAVPRLNFLTSSWHLDTASRQLASELRLLRQEAVKSGNQCKAEFYIYLNRYTLTTPQGKRHVYLPDTVTFEGSTTFSGLPPTLTFNSLGRPGSGGTVILKSGNAKRYIIITPVTGRIRVSLEPPQNW